MGKHCSYYIDESTDTTGKSLFILQKALYGKFKGLVVRSTSDIQRLNSICKKMAKYFVMKG